MSLDTITRGEDGEGVDAVVEALNVELAGRPRKAVSDALGLHPSQAGRILDGTRPLTPSEIATIERSWGLLLGTILRRAGLVHDASSVAEAIATDPTLEPDARRMLLMSYESVRQPLERSSTKRSRRRS